MPILALASAPIERVPADVAVVPLFAGERPLRDAAGRVDWRLCGRLSHLFAAGRLTGESGEAVLIPGGGGLRAPRVMGLGLGARDDLDAAAWERWIASALARSHALAAGHAVVALPDSDDLVAQRLGALAACAVQGEAPGEITLAPEPGDASAVADWLRAAARRARSGGLEIRPPGESRPPHGDPRAAAPAVSSRETAGRFTR